MREIEHLSEDNLKIQKIIDIMNSIRWVIQTRKIIDIMYWSNLVPSQISSSNAGGLDARSSEGCPKTTLRTTSERYTTEHSGVQSDVQVRESVMDCPQRLLRCCMSNYWPLTWSIIIFLSLNGWRLRSDINQNMSILFSKPEKRNQWEEAFSLAKQKLGSDVHHFCDLLWQFNVRSLILLATSFEKNAAPEFLSMIPIRKTRAGLQFTCAASTIGPMNDVWVCNSDGYVGQVCVLSLYPEPTVTSCNGVCNARILCVTSVPPSSYSEE